MYCATTVSQGGKLRILDSTYESQNEDTDHGPAGEAADVLRNAHPQLQN
jgi:hypothetical protein